MKLSTQYYYRNTS